MTLDFPDPEETTPDGILAIGGDLSVETLLKAYARGIFPWPVPTENEESVLAWFCPPQRAILRFADLHIPRSLEKARRKQEYNFTMDQCFAEVITQCQIQPRPGQDGTWITDDIKEAYIELHKRGFAHSVETWYEGKLVGGIYGVELRHTFAGESMFSIRSNASKLALLHLIDYLKQKKLTWMDIQVLTPHMESLGACEIPRREFLALIGFRGL